MTDMKRQSISLPDETVEAVAALKARLNYAGPESKIYRRLIEIGLSAMAIDPEAMMQGKRQEVSRDALALAKAYDNALDDAGRRFIKKAIAHEISRVSGKPL